MEKIENPIIDIEVLNKESAELKRKQKYTYKDFSEKKNGEIIFECETEGGILAADKLYEQKTGQNPSKQSSVTCNFEDI